MFISGSCNVTKVENSIAATFGVLTVMNSRKQLSANDDRATGSVGGLVTSLKIKATIIN